MKNIFIGVALTLVLIITGAFLYQQLQPKDFGSLKVILLAPDGKPAKEIEVDVNLQPGPPKFRGDTDVNGTVTFEHMPVGSYAIFFNKGNFPPVFEYPMQTYWTSIGKDKQTEKTIQLRAATR